MQTGIARTLARDHNAEKPPFARQETDKSGVRRITTGIGEQFAGADCRLRAQGRSFQQSFQGSRAAMESPPASLNSPLVYPARIQVLVLDSRKPLDETHICHHQQNGI